MPPKVPASTMAIFWPANRRPGILFADPLPMMSLFDKQIQLRMGQANVKRWIPDIMPFLTEDDPLGVDDFATHRLPLREAAAAYEMFQQKADGAVKIMLKPWP
jgi:threonine dehydrogenase-like Zn-dependent dehydrogenase